jgi:hypothetical protein
MFLRNYIKKFFGCQAEWLRNQLRQAEKERHEWQSQANVDATENLFLKKKLQEVRKLLGLDDECFSKYTRDQIEDMELDEFRQVKNEIDQDITCGKQFLQ